MQKIATEQKSTHNFFARAALWKVYVFFFLFFLFFLFFFFWKVYVYFISSTSMQKEHPVANSVRQIKIRCAKLEFHYVSKGIRKMQKIKREQKSTKKWFDRAALWRVYVYFISSTYMQKENPVANSVRQIKIRCAKYKGPLTVSMKISPCTEKGTS